MGVLETIRGDGQVSDEDAIAAFEVLAPVLHAAPADGEAIEAARHTISRMSPTSVLGALLDWWLVVTTGASSPLGHAFHLPETLPHGLRHAMAEVIDLGHSGITVPAAKWVESERLLRDLLGELDDRLILDSYGAVKIQGERQAWSWLMDTLAPTVDALRTGERAEPVELDVRSFERELSAAAVQENSRRWREMVKRATECVGFINRVVDAQAVVEPWNARQVPSTIDEIPDECEPLGQLSGLILEPVFADRATPDAAAVGNALGDLCTDATLSDLTWLASITDDWIATTGVTVPQLQPTLQRREQVLERIALARRDGIDVDAAEIRLLDHDLDGAERELDEVDRIQQDKDRAHAMRSRLEQLQRDVATGDVPEGWEARVQEIATLVDRGDLDAAHRSYQQLNEELRQVRRNSAVSELERIYHRLDELDGAAIILADLREHLEELRSDPARPVDAQVVDRNRERLAALEASRRREAEDGIRRARDLLQESEIRADALPDLRVQLREAEQLVDDNVMAALEVLEALLQDIEAQRVHRWHADEGEERLVDHVVSYCTQEVHFAPADVRRLFVAAKTKPFVILAGLTGSGKSTIARLFAAALGADARSGRFRRVAVRPDWIDQSEVLGTINPLSNRFEPGWLAEVARACESNPDQIHVVLLDEMNLAPVEQYLAEYLSALEEARSGSERSELPLYNSGANPDNRTEWPPSIPFPVNLVVIGTVNVDETTRVLSDRVLDRANVLQLSVAVSDTHHRTSNRSVRPWMVPFSEWDRICHLTPDAEHHELLVDIADLLQGAGIGVGQRAHVELERFVTNARGILGSTESLDLGILQRIVPKIRGFKRDLVDALVDLEDLLRTHDCTRSADVLTQWLDERVSDDEYLDGTDARIGLLR